jgi:transposase
VQYIINKWKYEGTVKNTAGRGRKRILTPADERVIVRKLQRNPKTSIPKLATEVAGTIGRPVSADTVRRVAHRSGLRGRVARKKPLISKVNMKKTTGVR